MHVPEYIRNILHLDTPVCRIIETVNRIRKSEAECLGKSESEYQNKEL